MNQTLNVTDLLLAMLRLVFSKVDATCLPHKKAELQTRLRELVKLWQVSPGFFEPASSRASIVSAWTVEILLSADWRGPASESGERKLTKNGIGGQIDCSWDASSGIYHLSARYQGKGENKASAALLKARRNAEARYTQAWEALAKLAEERAPVLASGIRPMATTSPDDQSELEVLERWCRPQVDAHPEQALALLDWFADGIAAEIRALGGN